MATFRQRNLLNRSDRMARVQLTLGEDTAEPIVLDQTSYIQSFKYEYGVETIFGATFVIWDTNYDEIESYIHRHGIGLSVSFQFGWAHGDLANGDLSPMYFGFVKMFESEMQVGGSLLTVEVQFPAAQILFYVPGLPDLETPEGVEIASFLVSVAQPRALHETINLILDAFDWPVDKRIIEPTSRTTVEVAWQPTTRFSSFLRALTEVAVPRSPGTGANEAGHYLYYIMEDGTFVFARPTYLQRRIYDSYVFGYANDGRTTSFKIADIRPILMNVGLGHRQSLYYDFDEGTPRVLDTPLDESGGLQSGSARSNGLARIARRAGAFPHVPTFTFSTSETDDEAIVRARDTMEMRLYSGYSYIAEAQILGDPQVPLRSLVRWTLVRKDGRPHYASGYYIVLSVRHEISSGGDYMTYLKLFRNAVNVGDLLATGRSWDAVILAEGVQTVLETTEGKIVGGTLQSLTYTDGEVVEGTTVRNPGARVGAIVTPDSLVQQDLRHLRQEALTDDE